MLKFASKLTLIAALALAVAGSALAQPKARKLNPDAYIKTAKIEITYGDTARYQYAMVMLDSLLMYYGPYAEAYYWMTKMMVDFHEKSPDFKKKRPFVEKMAIYADSLHQVCGDIKAKQINKKGCDKLIKDIDSIRVYFWRTFYSFGFDQLKRIDEQLINLKTETDSTARAEAKHIVAVNADSCVDIMGLAIIIDPSDPRAYVGIASAYEKLKDLGKSNEWLARGLERTPDTGKLQLIQNLAYNYTNMDKYCEAIPYFRQIIDLIPKDTGATATMYNLSICYNACKEYDSAVMMYRRILAMQPSHVDALTGVGRFFNQLARWANDSAQRYDSLKNTDGARKWRAIQRARFDSSLVNLGKVFELSPEDVSAAEEFGLICYLVQDWVGAAKAYERVTKLDATNVAAWTSLGDCLVYQRKYKEAVAAYEKVLAMEPKNRQVLDQLKMLYTELGQADKAAAIDVRIKKL
jgi:tetratricopeptide (TPR) repeat protein